MGQAPTTVDVELLARETRHGTTSTLTQLTTHGAWLMAGARAATHAQSAQLPASKPGLPFDGIAALRSQPSRVPR